MKKSTIKKIIKENLKEDVYYPPSPQPNNDEVNIEEIVSEVLDEWVGLDSASYIIKNGGERIELYSNQKALKSFENRDDEFKKHLTQGWKETCEEIIDVLDRSGYSGYAFGNASYKGAFIER